MLIIHDACKIHYTAFATLNDTLVPTFILTQHTNSCTLIGKKKKKCNYFSPITFIWCVALVQLLLMQNGKIYKCNEEFFSETKADEQAS